MYSAYLPSAKAFWVTMMCGSPPLVSLSNSGIHRPLSVPPTAGIRKDRKSTRLNSSHLVISYAVFCLKKKKIRHALIHTPMAFGREAHVFRPLTLLFRFFRGGPLGNGLLWATWGHSDDMLGLARLAFD